MRAHIESYGCTLNCGEAREIEDLLASRGWELVGADDDFDLAMLATCAVVQKTERRMFERIGELASARRLIITGCMANLPMKERVHAIAPQAEFLAPGDLDGLKSLLGPSEDRSPLPRRSSFAIVPISSGCLGQCSYCITRLARGDLRSRPPERVVGSVEKAVAEGPPREVRLSAQDAAAYGHDIGTDLPSLVKSVCSVPGDFKVRVGMMNPRTAMSLTDGLASMYREPKVFKFLHLPVQSGSDRILESMKRGYSVADFRRIVRTVRREVPDVSLSTDLIVGYPGEGDEDHKANLALISEFEPDIVNVTRFSPRPGTVAAAVGDRPPGGLVKERSREITRLRFGIALKRNRRWVGEKVAVLATERGKGMTTLVRTDLYQQIVLKEEIPLGSRHSVRITGATPTYLTGIREVVE